MYDTITPEQWVIGLVISLLVFGGLVWLLWHYSSRNGQRAPMSSAPAQPASTAGTESVHVPVPSPGSTPGTTPGTADATDVAAPDTDALEAGTEVWKTPRISTRLSDAEMIALLATQRGKDGKHRYSANKIHTLLGGARADVLAQVRALRDDSPTVFHPLTEEQQQLRAQLQMGER